MHLTKSVAFNKFKSPVLGLLKVLEFVLLIANLDHWEIRHPKNALRIHRHSRHRFVVLLALCDPRVILLHNSLQVLHRSADVDVVVRRHHFQDLEPPHSLILSEEARLTREMCHININCGLSQPLQLLFVLRKFAYLLLT